MKDKISIIIPTYNSENTIEKCINSLIEQTYKNLEIIVIDDCSRDNTLNILKKYKNNIILIKNKKNVGPGASRNKGLKVCSGKYIGFVDSDDYVEKTMYKKLAQEMSKNVDLVCCGRTNITANTKKEIINKTKETNPKIFNSTSNYNCDKLFKKSIIEKNKIKFPEKYRYAEDFAFLIKYKYYANEMRIIEEPLYNYVNNSNSLTKVYNENLLDIISVLQETIDFFKTKKEYKEFEYDLLLVSCGFYTRRIKEFSQFKNSKLQKLFVKNFLNYFNKNFTNYKKTLNHYKTKYCLFYRSSYYLMCIYIFIKSLNIKKEVNI